MADCGLTPPPSTGSTPPPSTGSSEDLSQSSDASQALYRDLVHSVPCQTYALARGYEEMLDHGAEVLVPAGLAWHAARGEAAPEERCRELIDAEYTSTSRLPPLPLRDRVNATEEAIEAPWAGEKSLQLFRYTGHATKYCGECHVDHHGSALGIYLNALVFYATLFGRSPEGATWPAGQMVDGDLLPGDGMVRGDNTTGAMTREEAETLQRIAAKVVLPHMEAWWPQGRPEIPNGMQ
eukprot:gene900-1413_t